MAGRVVLFWNSAKKIKALGRSHKMRSRIWEGRPVQADGDRVIGAPIECSCLFNIVAILFDPWRRPNDTADHGKENILTDRQLAFSFDKVAGFRVRKKPYIPRLWGRTTRL